MINEIWNWLADHFGVLLFYVFAGGVFVFWIVTKITMIQDAASERQDSERREVTPADRVENVHGSTSTQGKGKDL
jgi:hypothetical protein